MKRRDYLKKAAIAGMAAFLAPYQTVFPQPGMLQGITGPLRLNANENPYAPSKAALKAIREHAHLGNRYAFQFARKLVEDLCAKFDLQENQVLLGAGSVELLQHAGNFMGNEGFPLVAATPVFPVLPNLARRFNNPVVEIPLNENKQHDLPRMLKAVKENPGMVYVVNPNNPTGTIVPHSELLQFCKEASEYAYVVVDEAYIEYLGPDYAQSVIPLIRDNPKILVLRTFSKIFGLAGLRIGYAIAHPEMIDRLKTFVVHPNVTLSYPSIAAARASLNDEPFQEMSRRKIRESTVYVCEMLNKKGIRYIPTHTNFLYFDIDEYRGNFRQDMADNNILLNHVADPDKRTWCRLSIGKQEEMEVFINVLKKIWRS